MKLQACAIIIGCFLAAGCNRDNTDRGGTASSTVSQDTGSSMDHTRDRSSTPPAPVAPAETTPTPTARTLEPKADNTVPENKPADNTGRNVRDRADATVTPGDQGESKEDLALTQRIRQAVNKDDRLSTDAKNIKIITAAGKVTLRGPVNSNDEKQWIEEKAKSVEGVGQLDNQIEVKNPPQH